ncbi:MAG TPA: VWA domain-containing protein [bacterium]
MEKQLIEFLGLLRRNGIRITISETIDAFEILRHIAIGEKDHFKTALRAVLVKDFKDRQVFNELFEEYFMGGNDLLSYRKFTLDDIPLFALSHDYLRKIVRGEMREGFSPLILFLLLNDKTRFLSALRDAGANAGLERITNHLQINFFANKIYLMLGGENFDSELIFFKKLLADKGIDEKEIEAVLQYLRLSTDRVRELVKDYVGREFKKLNFNYFVRMPETRLLQKNFTILTDEEEKKMRDIIYKLAAKLKNRAVVKRKTGKKGKLDLRKTLRRNIKYDGFILKPVYGLKVKHKPKVIAICDVSDSVRYVSSFFLQFLHVMQESFRRVSSFIFSGDIGEVTSLFLRNPSERALEKIYKGSIINPYAKTNYGRVLKTFQKNFLGRVDKTTSVIIIGDGRNNHNQPEDDILDDIRKSSKNLVWLCPETKWSWWMGDSDMLRYAPHCDDVRIVTNLNDLYNAVREIVL